MWTSTHAHAVRVQYKKIKASPVGPPASITSSMRQDSLFVVASVCCQLARPVSACRLIHPSETKGSICDIHFSEAFFRVTAAAGAPAGGSKAWRALHGGPTEGEKPPCDVGQVIRSKAAADVYIWYVLGGGPCWLKPPKCTSQARPEDEVGGFTRRSYEPSSGAHESDGMMGFGIIQLGSEPQKLPQRVYIRTLCCRKSQKESNPHLE